MVALGHDTQEAGLLLNILIAPRRCLVAQWLLTSLGEACFLSTPKGMNQFKAFSAPRPGNSNRTFLALRGRDRVFGRFCDPKLHALLRRYINLFAGGRIPSDSRLAIYPTKPAEARKNEHSFCLYLFHRRGCEQVQKL